VQVSPVENAGSVRVRAEMKYVVVPDRFADDLLCEPGLCAGETVALPAAPMVLGLAGSGDALLEIACPGEGQTIDLLKGAGPVKQFSGVEIRLAKAPCIVGVLTGQRLWHEKRLGAKYDRKRIDLDWEMPVPGAWRLAVRVDGRTYSETFGDTQSPRLDGKRLFLTEQEEFSGLVDLALVYLYGRSSGTPLERLTPTDVALDAMGMEAYLKAFDLDGLQTYRTAPRPTTWADVFASLESLRHLYDRGVEKEEKAFAGHLCDDVPALFAGMDSRLDEFAAMTREAAEVAKKSEKTTPEAQACFAVIQPTLGRLEAACQRRSRLIPTADAIACAGQIKDLTPNELKSPAEKRKKFLELSGRLAQAARGRGDLIRALRALTRELRNLAGASCFEHPGLRDTATRLRQLAEGTLRNRYYFEADWRGEPYRVAPYWLGGRPY
jgi:hypothetical protein